MNADKQWTKSTLAETANESQIRRASIVEDNDSLSGRMDNWSLQFPGITEDVNATKLNKRNGK